MKAIAVLLAIAATAQAREFPITTHVAVSVPGLRQADASRVIWDALREWDRACGIAFKPGPPELFGLTIVTGTPVVDGIPSRRYASSHSGWPALGGVIRVNPAHRWNEAALRRVILHEVGHFMGREHSSDPASIMFPHPESAGLSTSDIEQATKIWGEPEQASEPTTRHH